MRGEESSQIESFSEQEVSRNSPLEEEGEAELNLSATELSTLAKQKSAVVVQPSPRQSQIQHASTIREISTLARDHKWEESDSSDSDAETAALYINSRARAPAGPNRKSLASSFTVYNEEDSFSEGYDGLFDWDTVLVHLKAGWKVWLMSLLYVCACTSKSVAMSRWLFKLLPSWDNESDHGWDHLSAYVVAFYGSMFLLVVAALAMAMIWLMKGKPPSADFSENWKWYAAAGLCGAVGHVLTTMVGHMHKTPHVVDLVFRNTRFLWSVPFSILFLETKRKYKWSHGFTFFSFLSLLGAVAILSAPIVATSATDFPDEPEAIGSRAVAYIIGNIALGLAPIFIEKFFYFRKRLQVGRSGTFDVFTLCFWISAFQFLFVTLLFWLDLVPHVGSVPDISSFGEIVHLESRCLFQVNYCVDSVWMGFIFVFSWLLELILLVKLSQDSSNFVQMITTISTPLVICFWIAFPSWETQRQGLWMHSSLWQNMPLWTVLPALLFFILGSVVFKVWEMRQSSLIHPRLAY
eukprot:TRINITY_DN1392_c0_g1_i11.p1 TRINITY_DN1392_c0_g1~~TRINITY_DN1392_c0_g1_i11.p1  ORF type:complete len:522 (-),score=106.97 TRINITY_DN1392_c0_g1_i11:25-1590(-)